MSTSFLFSLGGPEVILIVLVFLLLFGAKRIPELMQSLGKGINSFKKGLKDVSDEISSEDISKDKKENK